MVHASAKTDVSVERRSKERKVITLRIAVLHSCGSQLFCLLKNLSEKGALVRAYGQLCQSESVALELKSGHLLEGKVTWVNGPDVGITFYEAIHLDDALSGQSAAPGKQPRVPRICVSCPISLRLGSRSYMGRTIDISPSGLKAKFFMVLPPGKDTIAKLPELPAIAGTIRWRIERLVGISFNEPLTMDTLSLWASDRQ